MTLEDMMKRLFSAASAATAAECLAMAQTRYCQLFTERIFIIRAFFDSTPNFGHQSHTLLLLRRIIQDVPFTGRLELIVPDSSNDEKLKMLIPGYTRSNPFLFCGCHTVVCEVPSGAAVFGICGGKDEEPESLCALMDVEYVLCIQPFRWNVHSYWFHGTKSSKGYQVKAGSLSSLISSPVRYREAMLAPLTDVEWDAFAGLAHVAQARALVALSGRVRVWPVYGLHVYNEISCTAPSMVLLTLALSALHCIYSSENKAPVVMVLLNDDDDNYGKNDALYWYTFVRLLCCPYAELERGLLDALQRLCKVEKENAESITGTLLGAILELRKLLGEPESTNVFHNLHLLPASVLSPAKEFEAGHIYLYPLGGVPQRIFDCIFASARYPAFFEGQATTSLAFNLGHPFLQSSIHTKACNYPVLATIDNCSIIVESLSKLVERLRRGVYHYMAFKSQDLLKEWIEFSSFFQSYTNEGPSANFFGYFQTVGAWARDISNDKLLLGITHMERSLCILDKPKTGDSRSANPVGARTLEQVYRAVQTASAGGVLDLSAIFPQSDFAAYAASLCGGRPLIAVGGPGDVTAEMESGEIVCVRVSHAAWRLTSEAFCGELLFTAPYEALISALVGASSHTACFSGLSWLVLEDAGMRLQVQEGLPPLVCAATGRLAGTELAVEIDAIGGPLRHIWGEFPEPVLRMDSFFALAGGVNFVDSLPTVLRELGGFGLKRAELWVDERHGRVNAMQFSIETAAPWRFCEGVDLSFAPKIEVYIQNPQALQTRKIRFELGGALTLGGGTIVIVGYVPNFSLEVRLARGTIDLTEVAKLFSLDLDLKTSVNGLSLSVEPERHTYRAALSLETNWDFFGLFTVTSIGVTVEYRAGAAAFSLSGSIRFLPKGKIPLDLRVSAAYLDGQWRFRAALSASERVSLKDVLAQYTGNTLALCGENETDLALCRLEVAYATGMEDFCISAGTAAPWHVPFLNMDIEAGARIGRTGGVYFARIEALVEWNHIPLAVWYDYSQSGPYSHSFGLTWDVLTGTVSQRGATGEWLGTLSLAQGTTVGSIVSHMITWFTGTPFGLDAPWNLLDSIPLPACRLEYHFDTGKVALVAGIGPIKLGFATIEGVSLSYQSGQANPKDNGVMISLAGSFAWNTGDGAVGDQHSLGPWNAAEPGSAPAPGGQGNKYIDLRLLALGQHTHIFEGPIRNVTGAMEQLYRLMPPKEGALPPVRYDPGTGWLVGADLGILRENEGADYLVNLQLIFSDPDLYALRVRLEGTAAKVLKGLDFQVLYRKISDTVGVFQAEITLPDRMRYLSIGAYSLTLPVFGFAVYTNGDFQIDVGFPWNRDFSRSLSIQGIIAPGIPFTGAAGFYFARLSSKTAGALVPQADNGLFNPVLSFGFGLSVGIGKSIHYGILNGGFAVTVFGILEGVVAKWNPFIPQEQPDANLQSTYYFSIHGTVGLAGRLFAEIDFAILKASVNVSIELYVDFLFGSYQDTVLTLCAAVSASASLTLNLGLFKIHISFSFSIRVKETLTIRASGTAPWQVLGDSGQDGVLRSPIRLRAMRGSPPSVAWNHRLLPAAEKRTLRAFLTAAPAAAADEWGAAAAVPCCVALLTLDAGEDCFGALCGAVARWCVCCGLGRDMTVEEVDAAILTEDVAAGISQALETFSASLAPFPAEEIDALLSGQFRLRITGLDSLADIGAAEGAFFPIPPALRVSAPKAGDVGAVDYAFGAYNNLSDGALALLRERFDRLAVQLGDKGRQAQPYAGERNMSVASWVFSDYFLLLARQMARALRDALRNLRCPLDDRQRPQDVLDWVNARRGGGTDCYALYDLFASNQDHLLAPGKRLRGAGRDCETAAGDTLALIAGRLGVELADLSDGADGEVNAKVTGLFAREGGDLNLPHLGRFRVAELMAETRRAGICGTLSGLVSRYYLHGLRLPTVGITPRADGLWVRGGRLPDEAGLFALTGQLLRAPVPVRKPFSLSFTREPDAPDWLEVPINYTITIQPGRADAKRLEALAAYLVKGPLPLDCARLEETTFRPAAWAFAPPAALGRDRRLWMLPAALLSQDASGLRPALALSLERYDEATGERKGIPLTPFDYAALPTFRVRRRGTDGLYTVFCGSKQTPRRLERLLEACRARPSLAAGLLPVYHTAVGYGCGAPDQTAFDLIQTDLSTESHPPVKLAGTQAERVEPPELLELLWQALVTNNGGTCLRYRNLSSGGGLPEEIFSDGGDAELAFLIPLAPDGGGLPAWCDCVVSAMAIPAGTNLCARAVEQLHTLVCGDEAPADLGTDYLASLTDLARRNGDLPAREGSRWEARHVLYPASASAAPGLTPQGVADCFGVELSALQASNAWKTNWNESFRALDLVLIPPFAITARRGDTLDGLARRCFLPPATLLWQNRAQRCLLQPGWRLTLNACPGSYFGTLVPGCVGESFQRTAPGSVPDVSDDPNLPIDPDYARTLLTNQFTLLRYRVEETPWFAASAGSVPVGPDEHWRYAFSFPAARYAGKGDYDAVGGAARLGFEWLDLYGNRIHTAPATLTVPRLIGYTDPLLPLSRWPSFSTAWRAEGGAEQPALRLTLRFSSERYHTSGSEGAEEAGRDLDLIQTILGQLTDTNGVHLTLRTGLLKRDLPFPQALRGELLCYLDTIGKFLTERRQGRTAPAPERALTLRFPLDEGALCPGNLFQVAVAVALGRSAPPMAGYEEVAGISETESPIAPDADDLAAFARDFEAAFPALGLTASANDAAGNLWALRREQTVGDGGLAFRFPPEGREPILYAPRPVSNRLESRSGVSVYRYTPGTAVSERDVQTCSFQDVDLSVWLRELIEAMDGAFTPEIAAAARILDRLRGERVYRDLTYAKRALAGALATLLVPLFADQAPMGADTARESFRQRLLSALSNLYEVRAVALYRAETRSNLSAPGGIYPRLYGSLEFQMAEGVSGVSLTPAKLSLQTRQEQFMAVSVQAPSVVRSKNGAILPSLALTASYQPTHLEYNIRKPAGLGGYEDSLWLSLLLPDGYRRELGSARIPLPLTDYPQTPTLPEQVCVGEGGLWTWRYRFDYALDVHYPQNTLHCTVRFNETDSHCRSGGDGLFRALARCHAICGPLLRDIAANTPRIGEQTAPYSTEAKVFSAALRSLAQVGGEVAAITDMGALGLDCTRRTEPAALRFAIREGTGPQGELVVYLEGAQGVEVCVAPERYRMETGEDGGFRYRDRETSKLLSAAEGQSIPPRTVILPPESMFRCQSARASLYAEQNRGLIPGRELAECFLFNTGEVSFPAPCFPAKEIREEVDLSAWLGRAGTIREHLDAFFVALPDETDALFQIQASHRHHVRAGLPPVEVPIFMQTPVRVTTDHREAHTAAWAEELCAWRREWFGDLGWSEDESLRLEITVLSRLTRENAPMLTLKNAILPGGMLKDTEE